MPWLCVSAAGSQQPLCSCLEAGRTTSDPWQPFLSCVLSSWTNVYLCWRPERKLGFYKPLSVFSLSVSQLSVKHHFTCMPFFNKRKQKKQKKNCESTTRTYSVLLGQRKREHQHPQWAETECRQQALTVVCTSMFMAWLDTTLGKPL